MKNDWLKDIHDRMEDFEVEEPNGLWNDICSAESSSAVNTSASESKSQKWFWGAIAAACIPMLVMILPILNKSDLSSNLLADKMVPLVHKEHMENDVLLYQASKPKDLFAVEEKKQALQESVVDAESETSAPKDWQTLATDAEPGGDEETEKLSLRKEKYEDLAQEIGNETLNAKNKNHGNRLEVALMTGASKGAKALHMFDGEGITTSSVLGESEWADSPLLGIMTMNRGAETRRKVRYHLPIRTGVSLRYELNERWSVESGISYAFVSSSFLEGTSSNYVEEKQHLHYLGIPLGVSCRLTSWGNFDLYISGNVLAEQCIYAESAKRFYIANELQGDSKSSIASRPLQWSIGAKAGLQYKLSTMFSIYAEPGCIYYFDDHSPLENIFKKRAFDFSMNFGLRCSIGKKKQ